jgi:hypothetical protein
MQIFSAAGADFALHADVPPAFQKALLQLA